MPGFSENPQPEQSGKKSEKPEKAELDDDTLEGVPESVKEDKEEEGKQGDDKSTQKLHSGKEHKEYSEEGWVSSREIYKESGLFNKVIEQPEIISFGKALGEGYINGGNYGEAKSLFKEVEQNEVVKEFADIIRGYVIEKKYREDVIGWAECVPIKFPKQDVPPIEKGGVTFKNSRAQLKDIALDGFLPPNLSHARGGYQHPKYTSVFDPYAVAAWAEFLEGDLVKLAFMGNFPMTTGSDNVIPESEQEKLIGQSEINKLVNSPEEHWSYDFDARNEHQERVASRWQSMRRIIGSRDFKLGSCEE